MTASRNKTELREWLKKAGKGTTEVVEKVTGFFVPLSALRA